MIDKCKITVTIKQLIVWIFLLLWIVGMCVLPKIFITVTIISSLAVLFKSAGDAIANAADSLINKR